MTFIFISDMFETDMYMYETTFFHAERLFSLVTLCYSAVYVVVLRLSVRPSVRPSQVGVL